MKTTAGFTLIEMLLGAAIMSVVMIALIGAYLGQTALNTHARNLTLAMNDATRVMEEIREQNLGCLNPFPTALPPGGHATWDAWLQAAVAANGGGGKSIGPTTGHERLAVTCQDGSVAAGSAAPYCGPNQVRGGYRQAGRNPADPYDPIRVTVAVGWREGRRVLGTATTGQSEFQFSRSLVPGAAGALARWVAAADQALMPAAEAMGPPMAPPAPSWRTVDANSNGVIDSQAMLTTLVTCR